MVPLFWRSENGGRCEVKRAMLTTNRALLCTVKERSSLPQAVPSDLGMGYSSVSKKRIALLELDEVEQCFRRLRTAAMQLGRENDIDSFASRVGTLRECIHSEAPASEIMGC